MKSLFTSGCIAVFTAAAVASTASADPASQVSRVVQIGDLNLHTQDGAKVAARRIHIAADYVCGGDSVLWRQGADFFSCRNGAIDRALASLQAPLVSAALGRSTPTGMASR